VGPQSNPLRVKARAIVAILGLFLVESVFADATVEQAQEALKQQGFYYGETTGEKNADTTAAIRRFQIRNGLQVTGELNAETLHALNSNVAVSPHNATPTPRPTISPAETDITPVVPRSRQIYSPPPNVSGGNVFSNTPYEMAPPEVQRRVIRGAQVLLRSRGYFRGNVDGMYGPELEFSLRAYQSSRGIPPGGRLDIDTLASLGLLPGQQFPARTWRGRRIWPRPMDQPPVRGEWIPEDRDRDEH
jgi:Putative peptidoglycan binding domain.